MRCSFGFWKKARNTWKVSVVSETESWESSDEVVSEGNEREKSLIEKENKNGLAKEEKQAKHTRHTKPKAMGQKQSIWKRALEHTQPITHTTPRCDGGKRHPGNSHQGSSGKIMLLKGLARFPWCCHRQGLCRDSPSDTEGLRQLSSVKAGDAALPKVVPNWWQPVTSSAGLWPPGEERLAVDNDWNLKEDGK